MAVGIPDLVIVNGQSRLGQAGLANLEKSLAEAGHTMYVPKSPEQMAEWIEKAKAEGYEEIWLGGGDGTVRQAAASFVNTGIRLGILPFGTGNTLATELGIPMDPKSAIAFLSAQAAPRRIDVGLFNDLYFVNSVSLGLSTAIAEELKNRDKASLGKLAYLPAVLKAVSEAQALEMRVVTEDFEFDGRIVQFVAASTGRHAGSFFVTPDASIDDGLLSAYIVQMKEGVEVLSYGAALATGTHTLMENVLSTECRRISLELHHPTQFVLDGDIFSAQKAEISIVPGALTVLAARLR